MALTLAEWVNRSNPFQSSNDILATTYNGFDLWVAVGQSGILATSSDAVTWTSQSNPFSAYSASHFINCVTWGKELWVIGTDQHEIATSPDGINWTLQAGHSFTDQITGIAYGNGVYVAVGWGGLIETSTDGITWTPRSSSFGINNIRGVIFGNGIFLAWGGTALLETSPDGINWTNRTTTVGGTITAVGYNGNGVYTMVTSAFPGEIATSRDGFTWTTRSSAVITNQAWCVHYGGGLWLVGCSNGQLAKSTDAITWTLQTSYFTNKILALGYNGTWVGGTVDAQLGTTTFVPDAVLRPAYARGRGAA